MNKNSVVAVVIIILLCVGIVVYFSWQRAQEKPEPMQVEVPPPVQQPPPLPTPTVQQVIESPPAQPTLPKLPASDKLMFENLADLVGNKKLISLFNTEQIIHNIVATIDNLPRKRLSNNVMPIKQARGQFITEGSENDKAISTRNATRYAAYLKIAELIDSQKLVELYVRLYPLFQQAYEELGYPDKYFNDRLLTALDDLLATPDLHEPVKVIQPNVFYLYADPDLEARSAGQKILMRIGSKNAAKIKTKLLEIRQQLKRHMHDRKVDKIQ